MSLKRAVQIYREFHAKEPNELVYLKTEIPKIVVPVAFCPQISYHSNKWNKENRWHSYIHWWEHPTLICVSPKDAGEFGFEFENGFWSDAEYDLGEHRNEVTFLGYAIDFNATGDDRSKIRIDNPTVFWHNPDPTNEGESRRLEGSAIFEFDPDPNRSQAYVVCSPNGKVIYVIEDERHEVYAFLNPKCVVTRHGIEG